jgi:hypothetical protein
MDPPNVSPRDAVVAVGYALAGAIGTALAAFVAVNVTRPVQPAVYDAFYLTLGPWSATEAASILHIGVAGVLAAAVPTAAAEFLDGSRVRAVAGGFLAAAVALVVAFAAAAVLDRLGFLTVVVAYALFAAAALAALRYSDAASASTAAFVGSLPVLALLLLLLGFGLGWGGGYDVVAEPVGPSAVDGPAADFEDEPAVREDLFSAAACDPADGGVCRLTLRGYEHERRAARVLARHGVRCPFVNAPRNPVYDPDASFVAERDDRYYRVTCEAYGD